MHPILGGLAIPGYGVSNLEMRGSSHLSVPEMRFLALYVVEREDSDLSMFASNLPDCDRRVIVKCHRHIPITGCVMVSCSHSMNIFEAWSWGIADAPKGYDGYLLMGDRAAGPFVPAWMRDNWLHSFTSLLDKWSVVIGQGLSIVVGRARNLMGSLSPDVLLSIPERLVLSEHRGCSPLDSIFLPSLRDGLPGDFDWRMYLYLHPSTRGNISPEHAANHWRSHRFPYKGSRPFDQIFNWETYLNKYDDLRAAGICDPGGALHHFLMHGVGEGRTC